MEKALILEPAKSEMEIAYFEKGNSYEFIRNRVGGLLESFSTLILAERGIKMWLNEEGKIMQLTPSVAIVTNDGDFLDLICGTVVITKVDEEGETVGLSEEDIEEIKDGILYLESADVFTAQYGPSY